MTVPARGLLSIKIRLDQDYFAMLAALFIALIGIASHMSIAHLIPGYYLTLIDPSHCQKTVCGSALALPLSSAVDPPPLLDSAHCGPSPYVFLLSAVDKYSVWRENVCVIT